ncbi:MAG: universal stress protein [Solirubrobacteraceae bacterium]
MSLAVICGVDRDESSLRAAALAATLADELGGHVVLAHVVPFRPSVVPSIVPVGGRPITPSVMVELDEAEPAAAFAAVGEAIDGALVEEVVERGDPPSRLGAVARERGAALIVVGTHGRSRVGTAVLGSVAQELVAGPAPCPVVVVGPQQYNADTTWLAPGPLVCGVDGSEESGRAVTAAIALAERLAAALTFVAVGDDHDARAAALEAAGRAAEASGVDAELAAVRGDPASMLSAAARERSAPLLVLGSRGRGPLRSAVLGSVGAAAIRCAPCPVVLVPPTD